jgi:hypothetical protein
MQGEIPQALEYREELSLGPEAMIKQKSIQQSLALEEL